MTNNDDKHRKAELSRRIKDACHLEGADKFRAINQAYAELGLPVLMPDDWAAVDAMANQMDMPAQTTNHRLRRLAASTVEEYLRWVETSEVDGPCVLFGFDTRIAFDLSEHTVKELADQYLSVRYTRCDAEATTTCQRDDAQLILVVRYGEYICLYKCCDHCRAWFNDPDQEYGESIDFALPDPESAFSDNPRHVAT